MLAMKYIKAIPNLDAFVTAIVTAIVAAVSIALYIYDLALNVIGGNGGIDLSNL